MIDSVLAKFANHDGRFEVQERLECGHDFKTYALNYYQDEGLHTLEAFAEGTFTIGNKIQVERKYINSGSTKQDMAKGLGDNFTYYTRVQSMEQSPVCQIGLVHGFSEESDQWLEVAYQFALNGILVHIVDNDSFGFSSGMRGPGPTMVKMHYNLACMLEQFEENLPSFLYGNSMGCMIINTFLLRNPDLPIQGVIFGSPFFEFPKHVHLTPFRKWLAHKAAPGLEPFAMQGTVQLHKVSQGKSYIRKASTQRKAVPIISAIAIVSMLDGIDYLQKNARSFNYPFLLMQGQEDTVVSNEGAIEWY